MVVNCCVGCIEKDNLGVIPQHRVKRSALRDGVLMGKIEALYK